MPIAGGLDLIGREIDLDRPTTPEEREIGYGDRYGFRGVLWAVVFDSDRSVWVETTEGMAFDVSYLGETWTLTIVRPEYDADEMEWRERVGTRGG